MNPQDFPWSEDQHVTVVNPTEKDYNFQVHSKNYVVGAGKQVKMPGFIAWVYVYGLASQLAQQENTFESWNDEDHRKTYYDRLIKKVDAVLENVEVVEEPDVNTFDDAEVADDEEVGNENEPADENEAGSEPTGPEDAVAEAPPAPKPGTGGQVQPMKPGRTRNAPRT